MTELAKEEDEKQLHRLREMLVEEVSVVDRAANKRRFVIVKNQDGRISMADGTELRANADGSFAKTEEAKTEEAAKTEESSTSEEQTDTEATTEAKSDDTAATEEAAKTEEAKTEEAKTEETSDESPLVSALTAATQDDITAALKSIGYEVATAEKTEEAEPTEEPVVKAGARMAKDRFRRFKQAVEMLTSVLSELSPEPDPGVKSAPGKKTKTKTKTKKSDEPDPMIALVTQVEGLASVVKTTMGTVEEIQKSRGAGNAVEVEGGSKPPAKDVSWPRDMTRPITRETVTKERGFWDD